MQSSPLAPASVTAEDEQALSRVFSAYTLTGTLWLLFGTAVGLLVAFKFGAPDFWAEKYLTFGRLRPIHTNSVFYGFATLMLIGAAYHVVARSCGTRLYSAKLAWLGLWLFNIAAVAGTVALSLGYNYGDLEYREWPWPIRLIFIAAVAVTGWNLLATMLHRASRDLYLSNWYIGAGVLWGSIIAIVAIIPIYQHGLGMMAISGYYMHNAVGMWFTPLALGLFYYAIPKVLNRPIYSYSLGVLAFWTNLMFYPLLGGHHFLFSPLPWWLQTAAVICSVAMIVPVFAGSANYLLTMRGRYHGRIESYPLAFLFIGVLCYLFGSTQGTLEALRSLQDLWHFTNFTVGHSHLTMYGFVTFAAWGAVYALLPLSTGKNPGRFGMATHFWLALVGMGMYVIALSIGGSVQGWDWIQHAPFIKSVTDMKTYYLWRGIGGMLMFVSHIVFAWNVWRMTFGKSGDAPSPIMEPEAESTP
ncbi:MAG: cytochrome oxidase [Nevskiaceae bacterium]|nr:MAG: cytochrome oxidase [Nevskiaceae bacterium]TBR74836.1 MAG: cytochrome oxidase [Nevskiaceae bacterium]